MSIKLDDDARNITHKTLSNVRSLVGNGTNPACLSRWELEQFALVKLESGSTALKSYYFVQCCFILFAQLFGFYSHITLCTTLKPLDEFLELFDKDIKKQQGTLDFQKKRSLEAIATIITSIFFLEGAEAMRYNHI